MKRLIIILSIISISVIGFANSSFDPSINYQGDNATAYVGEILYLPPLTGSWYGKNVNERYHNFKSVIYQDGYDDYAGPNTGLDYQYKFDPYDYRDCKTGTHKRHIEGHRFYVKKAVQDPTCSNIWTFHLTDLNTGDNLKFIYYTDINGSLTIDFPFIAEKHYKYCKSLIGTKLVFGTKEKHAPDLGTTYYPMFTNDIITGEKIEYSNSYEKWIIKDVKIDTYRRCICFIVTNGKQTTKVPYNIQYSPANKMQYNNCTRVFTENQWNSLIKKYGENHMEAIMDDKPLDTMSQEELFMVGGYYAAHGLYKDDNKSATEIVVNALVNSTKETAKTYKEIFKSAKNALFN